MGVTKSLKFSAKQNKLASLLKAIGHPARIAIIEQLAQEDACICMNFVNDFGLAQATISQHLDELKEVGLIKGCKNGTRIEYCMNEKVWSVLQKELSHFFSATQKKTYCKLK